MHPLNCQLKTCIYLLYRHEYFTGRYMTRGVYTIIISETVVAYFPSVRMLISGVICMHTN